PAAGSHIGGGGTVGDDLQQGLVDRHVVRSTGDLARQRAANHRGRRRALRAVEKSPKSGGAFGLSSSYTLPCAGRMATGNLNGNGAGVEDAGAMAALLDDGVALRRPGFVLAAAGGASRRAGHRRPMAGLDLRLA